MIARINFSYGETRTNLLKLWAEEQSREVLRKMLLVDDGEKQEYSWGGDYLIDLQTDGAWLAERGVAYEVRNLKGTIQLTALAPETREATTVYVQVPHVGLLSIDEVKVEQDYCTERLQDDLDKGWRILCVCPPNAQRRPDYILGRTKAR